MFSPSTARLRLAAPLTLLALLAGACQSSDTADPLAATDAATTATAAQAPTTNLTEGCATDAAEGVDWFPEQVTFDVASGISASYDGNVKTVTIDRPSDSPEAQPYTVAMVQCGTSAEGVQADAVIEVPVDGVATYSTTFVHGFELIDRLDAIGAHGGLAFVSSEALLAAAEAGEVVEVGDQTAPDLEVLAAAEPDVVLASAGFGGADATEPFAALDIPVIPNASYLEIDPLGRSEWLKLEAMLLNEEAAATAVFEDITADYLDLQDLAAGAEERPRVLTNAPFEGTWFVSGGQSYTDSLIEAAGGEHVFDDLEGSAVPLDLEVVLDEAQDADVWLSAGSVLSSPEEFLAGDERLGQFAAFPDQVWANDADLGPGGGSRFYEDGAVRPDLVLADLIAILHPDLLPDHEPRFFGLLGSQAEGDAAGDGG